MMFNNASIISVPAGTVIFYVGTVSSLTALVQNGQWLLCDGTPVPTATWPDLFQAIGFGFGGNQSNSTFYLPDLRGMFLRGVNGDAIVGGGGTPDPDCATRTGQPGQPGDDPGNSGNNVGSVQVDAVANHSHNWDHFFYEFSDDGGDIACHMPADSPNLQQNTRQATNFDGGVAPGSVGIETRPKNVYVYYLICTGAAPAPSNS